MINRRGRRNFSLQPLLLPLSSIFVRLCVCPSISPRNFLSVLYIGKESSKKSSDIYLYSAVINQSCQKQKKMISESLLRPISDFGSYIRLYKNGSNFILFFLLPFFLPRQQFGGRVPHGSGLSANYWERKKGYTFSHLLSYSLLFPLLRSPPLLLPGVFTSCGFSSKRHPFSSMMVLRSLWPNSSTNFDPRWSSSLK